MMMVGLTIHRREVLVELFPSMPYLDCYQFIRTSRPRGRRPTRALQDWHDKLEQFQLQAIQIDRTVEAWQDWLKTLGDTATDQQVKGSAEQVRHAPDAFDRGFGGVAGPEGRVAPGGTPPGATRAGHGRRRSIAAATRSRGP
jgi:hypothetical protein